MRDWTDFIPYQEAFELEELGFNEPCFGYHLCKNSALGVYLEITTEWIDLFPYDSSSCKAPTYSQAFRFFRDKYDLRSWIESFDKTNYKAIILNHYGSTFNSPEEAELECLRKLIKIAKSQPA